MVTVLVYSSERPYYLRRAVAYWSNYKFNVFITDGSLKPLIFDHPLPENVKYFHRPAWSLWGRLHEVLGMVSSRYVVLSPDDDFIDFDGIDRAEKYLENNAGFSAVQGLYIRFGHLGARSTDWMWDYTYARDYIFEQGGLESRLSSSLNYPVMHYCYAVAKKESVVNAVNLLKEVDGFPPSIFELSFLIAIMSSGKYATLQSFYGARQAHTRGWVSGSIAGWVSDNALCGYDRWRRNIKNMLMNGSELSEAQAVSLVDLIVARVLEHERKKNNVSTVRRHRNAVMKLASQSKGVGSIVRNSYSMARKIAVTLYVFNFHPQCVIDFIKSWLQIKSILRAYSIERRGW